MMLENQFQKRIFGNVKFDDHHGLVSVLDGFDNELIEGHIGMNMDWHEHPNPCRNFTVTKTQKCLEWHRKAKVTIEHVTYPNNLGINCYKLHWESLNSHINPKDCYSFGHGHWYGGGESLHASWPLESGHINKTAFVTGDEVSYLASCK